MGEARRSARLRAPEYLQNSNPQTALASELAYASGMHRGGDRSGGGGEAAYGHLAQDFLLLVGPADDFLKGRDQFLLVVNQPAQGGELRAAGEFADVPRVLREQVE
jgi:hypothetical protein